MAVKETSNRLCCLHSNLCEHIVRIWLEVGFTVGRYSRPTWRHFYYLLMLLVALSQLEISEIIIIRFLRITIAIIDPTDTTELSCTIIPKTILDVNLLIRNSQVARCKNLQGYEAMKKFILIYYSSYFEVVVRTSWPMARRIIHKTSLHHVPPVMPSWRHQYPTSNIPYSTLLRHVYLFYSFFLLRCQPTR